MDDSPQLIVYTNSRIRCPYCILVKNALNAADYRYDERDIADPVVHSELMAKRPTAKTVPQVFLTNDTYIGGCDDLMALIKKGKLDLLIELNT